MPAWSSVLGRSLGGSSPVVLWPWQVGRGQERQEGWEQSWGGGTPQVFFLHATIRAFLGKKAPHTWSPRVQAAAQTPLRGSLELEAGLPPAL